MGIALSPDVSIKPMRHGTEAGERLNQSDMSGGGQGGVKGSYTLALYQGRGSESRVRA